MKYHLARGEEQLGTFSDLELSSGLRHGQFKLTDLCWTEGMSEWQTLAEHLKELGVDTEVVVEAPAVTALREVVRKDHEWTPEVASRGQRLAAKLIDLVLVLIPTVIIMMTVVDGPFLEQMQAMREDSKAMMEALQQRIEKITATGDQTLMIMGWLTDILVIVNVVMLSVRGQTIGKLLLGVEVVRFSDGSRAGFLRAFVLRSLLFFIILIFLPIVGPLLLLADSLMIFRQDRRCLHDLVADTRVVRRQKRR